MTDSSAVNHPKHYEVIKGIEAVDIIRLVLDELRLSPFESYALGNILKYRLRAGNKDGLEQDIAKANKYKAFIDDDGSLADSGRVRFSITTDDILGVNS